MAMCFMSLLMTLARAQQSGSVHSGGRADAAEHLAAHPEGWRGWPTAGAGLVEALDPSQAGAGVQQPWPCILAWGTFLSGLLCWFMLPALPVWWLPSYFARAVECWLCCVNLALYGVQPMLCVCARYLLLLLCAILASWYMEGSTEQ